MMILKLTFLFLILFFVFTPVVLAQEDASRSAAIIKTDHVAGFFEKLGERINSFFKFSGSVKADYYTHLTKKRFGELKYVIDSGQGEKIEEVSSRYSTYAGVLTQHVVSKKIADKKDEILKMFNTQSEILKEYAEKFPYESGFWILIQHDINALNIYSEQLKVLN